MKRCPECRRDYYDETLLYCLDDGTELLEGPASADEQQTAFLTDLPSEGPTRGFATPASRSKTMIAGVAGILLVTALGIGSYIYYDRSSRQIDSIAVIFPTVWPRR